MRRFVYLAVGAVFLHTSAAAACEMPVAQDDGWAVAAPASVGLDERRLCAILNDLERVPRADIHAVLVARHGKLVFEQYFRGPDEIWGHSVGVVQQGIDVKHDLRSITKSVTSLLFGIAIDRKLIKGVDEPLFKFFPEYADLRTPEKDRILLRHVLTMSTGFTQNKTSAGLKRSKVRAIRATDPYGRVLQQPLGEPPGAWFNYTGGQAQLLEGILRKVTGKPLDVFAREALFAPLGITDTSWARLRNGAFSVAYGLRLRPRDLAKIGQLVLQQGQWNGKQIVSAEWIRQSTTPQIEGDDNLLYGYEWWLGHSLINKHDVPWISGRGVGGQRLFIVPALDMVVVINAGHYPDATPGWLSDEIFRRFVMRAVETTK